MNTLRTTLLGLLSLSACAPSTVVNDDPEHGDRSATTIRVFGRSIDVARIIETTRSLDGFWTVDSNTGWVFWTEQRNGRLELAGAPSSKTGAPIADGDIVNFDSKDLTGWTFFGMARYSAPLGAAIIDAAPDGGDGRNLYAVAPGANGFEQLTNHPYIYAFEVSPDGKQVAYSMRHGMQETDPGELRVMDLVTRTERTVWTDTADIGVSFYQIAWAPDSSGVFTSVLWRKSRDHQNVLYVPLTAAGGQARLLRPGDQERQLKVIDSGDPGAVLVTSTEAGKNGVYVVSTNPSTPPRRLSVATDDVYYDSAAITRDASGKRLVGYTTPGAISNTVRMVDYDTGTVLASSTLPETLRVWGGWGGRVISYSESVKSPREYVWFEPSAGSLAKKPLLSQPPERLADMLHCDAELITYEAHDGFAPEGQNGKVPAVLYRPKRPLPAPQQILIVETFYGGSNTFTQMDQTQVLCAAGITVLSPTVRGAGNWGAAYEKALDGDLGSGEVLDAAAAAREGNRLTGIPPERTGAYGFSHGGYAALRALTFGDTTTGAKPYPWGFGISSAGFGNLFRIVTSSNVGGSMVSLMGGQPTENMEKWTDRSPELTAARARGPILLTHGDKDQRVPPAESELMAKALRDAGKTVEHVVIPGQGHFYGGTPAWVTYYQAVADFLSESVVEPPKAEY